MSAVALVVTVILGGLAGLPVAWAFGRTWPARTEADLIRTVVGDPRLRRMPGRGLTLTVAGCLGAAAGVAILLRWPGTLPRSLIGLAGLGLAAVFVGRGIAGYVPAWRRAHPLEPFNRLDRIVYSPLCLVLGLGFGLLAAVPWSHP